MKKVGILGSGMVGQALGTGFIKYGHEVMIGSRNTSKLEGWINKAGEQAHTGSFNDAAQFGEIIVLACKGSAAKEVLYMAGAENLHEKTIIDATNPISEEEPVQGVLHYFTSLDRSLMEELQDEFPDAKFVKSFSVIGSHLMVNPDFGGIRPSMFICGNSEEAKTEVSDILDMFGFEVEDMGAVEAARAVEPLAMLWCIPGFRENRWTHALKLLKP
jgi:predicted dinucleotide-binding enzyme